MFTAHVELPNVDVRPLSNAMRTLVTDATPEQMAIREINPSYYIFKADQLFDRLGRLSNENASGEYYLTDVFELMRDDGLLVEAWVANLTDNAHLLSPLACALRAFAI